VTQQNRYFATVNSSQHCDQVFNVKTDIGGNSEVTRYKRDDEVTRYKRDSERATFPEAAGVIKHSTMRCQVRFVKIPAILSTVPGLSCVVFRKRQKEDRATISIVKSQLIILPV